MEASANIQVKWDGNIRLISISVSLPDVPAPLFHLRKVVTLTRSRLDFALNELLACLSRGYQRFASPAFTHWSYW